MLGGNGYICEVCPQCGANDLWNGECMTCGYTVEPEEYSEESED